MRLFHTLRNLDDITQKLKSNVQTIDNKLLEESLLYESSLHEYVKGMWPIIEGGRPFVDGWHLQAICEHLEAVYNGQIKRLLVNIPPRTSKSSCISVAFPTWSWAKDPTLQYLCISYGARLSMRDNVKCRRVIESKWYQDRWSHKYKLSHDVNTKSRFDNDRSGYRIATSVGSSYATGEGGDLMILDDPNSADDAISDVKRESANDWCDHTLSTRLNDQKTGRVVIVQQRLHNQDYSGHILEKELPGLVHLMLPMEFESSRRCITIPLKSTNGEPWEDPRKKEGELLWPERIGNVELDLLKAEMGSPYVVAGQLQQRPSPEDGGIFQKDWFSIWKEPGPPQCEFILQSWDTAFSDSANACWSACTNWGVFKDNHGVSNVILLSMWRGKVEHPEVRKMALRLADCIYDTVMDDPVPADYIIRPHMILIEGKANGSPLAQELNRSGLIVNRFNPTPYGKKIQRARLASGTVEAGKIWLPARRNDPNKLRPFADIFMQAALSFPNDSESADLIDSMSQAIIKLRNSGYIGLPDDIQFSTTYRKKEALY